MAVPLKVPVEVAGEGKIVEMLGGDGEINLGLGGQE